MGMIRFGRATTLVAFLIVTFSFSIAWYQAAHSGYESIRTIDQWQPNEAKTRYSFNFTVIDTWLMNLPENWRQQWQHPSNQLAIIQGLVTKFPAQLNQQELKRIGFLIAKTFPDEAGQQLSQLSTRYFQYQQAEKSNSTDANAETQFQQTMARQREYFGPVIADQLFGKTNALTRYLLERKKINDNRQLEAAEKQQKLHQLHQHFYPAGKAQ